MPRPAPTLLPRPPRPRRQSGRRAGETAAPYRSRFLAMGLRMAFFAASHRPGGPRGLAGSRADGACRGGAKCLAATNNGRPIFLGAPRCKRKPVGTRAGIDGSAARQLTSRSRAGGYAGTTSDRANRSQPSANSRIRSSARSRCCRREANSKRAARQARRRPPGRG